MDLGGNVPAAPPPGATGAGRVVVGVDRSPASRDALRYALTAAAHRGAPVEVVSTYPVPLPWGGGTLGLPDPEKLYGATRDRTAAFLEEVRQGPPVAGVPALGAVETEVVVSEGPAAAVLVERSREAGLLVVGSRGRGPVRTALLGSVALHCVTQAPCPVVVVRADAGRPPVRGVVVVGIDGSEASRTALVAALDEAGRRGAAVEAVAVYHPGDDWTDLYSFTSPGYGGIRADVERGARQMTEEVVASVRASGAAPVEVRTVFTEGRPSEVLAERSRDAELLVLGSRGLAGFSGLVLGSVTLRCLNAAACPVMVLHPPRHAWAETAGAGG